MQHALGDGKGRVGGRDSTVDGRVQEHLADVLELRAADLQQRAMLEDYLRDLPLAAGARILEIGCGTGAVTRTLARMLDASEVVGLDPGCLFIEQARRQGPHTYLISPAGGMK